MVGVKILWDNKQLRTIIIAAIFSILTSAQAIFIILAKSENKYDFSPPMLNVITEGIKLFISLSFLLWFWIREGQWGKEDYTFDKGVALLHFLGPALMYAFKNILQFSAAKYMDAPTYQVLKNLNIIATGIMFYFTFGRSLDRRQFECMILLLVGVSLIQMKPENAGQFQFNSLWGLFLCFIIAVLSAGGGIYTELLIKKAQQKSLHIQNLQLYAFGILCNALLYFWDRDPSKFFYEGLMTYQAFCVIFTTVTSGLAASMLLKYADNIVKVYSSGLSVVFTAFYAIGYMNFQPSMLFWFGTIIIIICIDIYYMKLVVNATSAVAPKPTDAVSLNIQEASDKK
jgi:UDP-sugar transporter A1/2/3